LEVPAKITHPATKGHGLLHDTTDCRDITQKTITVEVVIACRVYDIYTARAPATFLGSLAPIGQSLWMEGKEGRSLRQSCFRFVYSH